MEKWKNGKNEKNLRKKRKCGWCLGKEIYLKNCKDDSKKHVKLKNG